VGAGEIDEERGDAELDTCTSAASAGVHQTWRRERRWMAWEAKGVPLSVRMASGIRIR
jgi:hypothetical protein